jgi:hypothetical protein
LLTTPDIAAGAPTVALNQPCYAEESPIVVTGNGYTPGGEVALMFAANGKVGTVVTRADSQGAINDTVRSPALDDFDIDGRRGELSLTANDQARIGSGAPPEEQFAAATFQLTSWGVDVAPWNTDGPARGRPRRSTTFDASGWVGLGDTLYAHYRRNGRTVRSVRIGALTGPCGDLKRRVRQFPFRPVPAGTYRVVFSTSPTYRGTRNASWYRAVVVRREDAVG